MNNKQAIAFVLTVLCFIAIFIFGCKKTNDSPEGSREKEAKPIDNVIKISGSKEDLCRIVMVQNRSSSNSEVYGNVIATALTDGSDQRTIADVDSMIASLRVKTNDNFNSWDNVPLVTRDMKKAIVEISYKNPPDKEKKLEKNIAVFDIESKKWHLLFSPADQEYSSLHKEPRLESHYFSQKILFPNTAMLFLSKYSSIWRYDCISGERKKFQELYYFRRFNLLPISSSECYVNFYLPNETEKNSNFHIGRFYFNTQKLIRLPSSFDGFSLSSNSISEDGNTILIYQTADPADAWSHKDTVDATNETDTIQNDTVYVFNKEFQKQKFFILRNGTLRFRTDPIGKWLYFGNDSAIFRCRLDQIADKERTSFDELQKRAQTVWVAPMDQGRYFSYKSFFITRTTN